MSQKIYISVTFSLSYVFSPKEIFSIFIQFMWFIQTQSTSPPLAKTLACKLETQSELLKKKGFHQRHPGVSQWNKKNILKLGKFRLQLRLRRNWSRGLKRLRPPPSSVVIARVLLPVSGSSSTLPEGCLSLWSPGLAASLCLPIASDRKLWSRVQNLWRYQICISKA